MHLTVLRWKLDLRCLVNKYLSFNSENQIALCSAPLYVSFTCLRKDDDKNSGSNPAASGSDNQLLMSKTWTSTQIFNSGMDLTSQVSPISYDFNSGNTYISSSSTGTTTGTWFLNGSILTLDGNNWSVLELNANALKIDDNVAVVIYFQ